VLNSLLLLLKKISMGKQIFSRDGLKSLLEALKSDDFSKEIRNFRQYRALILGFSFLVNLTLFTNIFLHELASFIKHNLGYLLVLLIIIFDIFFYQIKFDWFFLIVFSTWLFLVVSRFLKSEQSFSAAVFIFIFAMFLIFIKKDLMAEKASVWAFLFLIFGLAQSLFEEIKEFK